MSEPRFPIDDGLVIPEVGPWSKRKYHFLARYLEMFSTGMKNKWPQCHYIDLFAAAGISRIRGTGELVRSSALIGASVRDPFTGLHYCERDPEMAKALEERLKVIGVADRVRVCRGDINQVIDELLDPIPNQGALSVAFADPYGLHLDFDTVRKIATKHCDLIVLLADNMDALRNWARYYSDNPDSNLDRFMGEPGWRQTLTTTASNQQAQALRERYEARLHDLGYAYFAHERVKNTQGADIYTLVFASRSLVGLKFWKQAAAVDEKGQRQLFD